MAAREGVGAALTRRLHIFESPAMDRRFCSLVRRISREINCKRVTSVEVNSNQTVLKGASLKSATMDGRFLVQGKHTKRSVLGLYGQAARLISIS